MNELERPLDMPEYEERTHEETLEFEKECAEYCKVQAGISIRNNDDKAQDALQLISDYVIYHLDYSNDISDTDKLTKADALRSMFIIAVRQEHADIWIRDHDDCIVKDNVDFKGDI